MKCLYILLLILAINKGLLAASMQKINLYKSSSVVPTEKLLIDRENTGKDVPYIVSLGFSSIARSHICAGTIIGKEWVLTAAHCIANIKTIIGKTVEFPVIAGVINRQNMENGEIHFANFTFIHKDFSVETGNNDIAMIHVSPPFNFSTHIKPIALPYLKENNSGALSVNYGWGLLNPDDSIFASDLQVSKENILTHEECVEMLPATAPMMKSQICVKIPSCYGYGGSPLVIERNDGNSELIGLTSWGYLPCGRNNTLTVLTSVSNFLPWIADVQSAYYFLY